MICTQKREQLPIDQRSFIFVDLPEAEAAASCAWNGKSIFGTFGSLAVRPAM